MLDAPGEAQECAATQPVGVVRYATEDMMAVFYSFHYGRDAWRVQQVVNMGALEGQPILNAQDWENIKRGGDQAIRDWIAEQMKYKTAVVVLVGAQTDGRRWVKHEITKAWNDKRPLIGLRIHGGLADSGGNRDSAGGNPFAQVKFESGGSIADYVPLYSPSGATSPAVYTSIKNNIAGWVANAYKRT